MGDQASLSDDPYLHLHDEDYAAPFAAGRVGASAMIAMGGRPREGLEGQWRFTLDLHDEGLRQRWYDDLPAPIDSWTLPRDHDDGVWQKVPVPSCWNVLKPEWHYFEGSAWYAREFAYLPGTPGERVFLRIGAANYEARLFVNGRFAGGHRGGSTPFFIEVTDFVAAGENRLQIQVENRRQPNRVPMNHTDWFNYGGLYRDVSLLRLPSVFIKEFRLTLVPGSGGRRIRADVALSQPIDGVAHLDIDGLAAGVPIPVTAGEGSIEIDAAPRLWSPQTPVLYPARLAFGADEVTDRVGFREIKVEGQRILLNGEDVFLRGICVHEDDIALGKATSEEDIRRRFRHVRALNANFVRLSHYPHHERAAEIADEEGVLLWAEIPVYWAIDFASPDTLADADNQLRELIRRDMNRASIIIWGVGNENHDTDPRFAFMSALARTAREADGTRLVSAACLINREQFRIEDRLAEVLDVIGINEYFGWYEPSFAGLERLLANSSPGKPVIITETGADAPAGRHGPDSMLFTEEHQARVLDRQLTLLGGASYIRGIAPWILYDFRTERRQTTLQRGWNLKGLISSDKTTRKLAFAVVAERYRAWSNARGRSAQGGAPMHEPPHTAPEHPNLQEPVSTTAS